ncbi:hypothetical protein Tco_0109740, partial [Tanacetum coccineum]
EDPFEAIRQAYLDGTDTESELFKEAIDTETLEFPLAIAPPIPLSESTPPILVPIPCGTAHMVVRIPPAMSSGLSASMVGVAAMSESALRKRFWSSYKSSPSMSSPDLPSRKHYRGTSELVEDSEEDDDEEDEEIEESMDSDSMSEDAEDEDDESCGIDDEGHSVESDGRGLEEEEAIPGGQQQAAPIMRTTMSAPLGLGYEALRRCELELEEGDVYSTFEVGQGSGSAPESGRPERVSVFRQPTLTTWTDPEDATPAAVETVGILTELGAQVEMQGGFIRDHAVRLEELPPNLFERYDKDIGELFTRSGAVREEIFSQRYQFRSVEYE